MPFMQICTTLSRSQIPQNLGQLVAVELSKTLPNKPVEKFCVHIIPDQVIFTSSQNMPDNPIAIATLRAMGAVTVEDNRKTINIIAELLHKHLNIPKTAVQMFFTDIPATTIARSGIVLADRVKPYR